MGERLTNLGVYSLRHQSSKTLDGLSSPLREASLSTGRVTIFRILTTLLSCSTLCLLFMGALVTSHGAGLAVPDWPTTFGENMFAYPASKWTGGVFFEHVHRLIASGIGFMTVMLALWCTIYEQRAAVRIVAYLSLIIVIIQGLLGGLTVLYKLPVAVSSLHGILGQTFFLMSLLLATIAWTLPATASAQRVPLALSQEARKVSRMSLAMLVFMYIQLTVAAVMRHSEAGLAIPDFPLMAGKIIPDFSPQAIDKLNVMRLSLGLRNITLSQALIHFTHRLLAVFLVAGYTILLARIIAVRGKIPNAWIAHAKVLAIVVTIQFALGAFTIWTVRDPFIASAHVVCGAVLLGATGVLAFRSMPLHRIFSREE